MIDLSGINIEVVENDGKSGIFKIGPLPKGYGHTFGNPLRRVLLSSLYGGAVTSMRITGIEHEYSTLKGVKETVVEIQMNIKMVQFQCESNEPQVLKLQKKGVGDVVAGDFQLSEAVKVVDPNVKIATITDKATTLEMEVVVERGIGYRIADEELRSEVGRLPMNADFSPVERVTFSIERTRKGEQMDLDLVVLSIFTDGSVDPLDALGKSAEILKVTFEKMMMITGIAAEEVDMTGGAEASKSSESEVQDWMIEDLPIWKRAKRRLLEAGMTTIGEVSQKTSTELLEIPGFGEAALDELKKLIKEYGLALKE